MADTIFALSSGRPPAGIAVIRVSGPRAFDAGRAIAGELPAPRHASLRTFRHPESGDVLDRGLLLAAPAPGTATGENIVEFQCHGGQATIDAMLSALAAVDGLRMAEGGEFTRQALGNGILDLTAAEGLADLLAAETELQRKVALRRAEGSVGRAVETIRNMLLQLAASVELAIDYVDEEDGASAEVPDRDFGALLGSVQDLLNQPGIERLRHGVRVVVGGPPNAGKSSLVNVLAREERVIVTPVAGTTRDTIEIALSLGGIPVTLVDTAGLRETEDEVEQIGIERAERALAGADLVLWLGPPDEAPAGSIVVASKADLGTRSEGIPFSATSSIGHGELVAAIIAKAEMLVPGEEAVALTLTERDALKAVETDVCQARIEAQVEIKADLLRTAMQHLDRITGHAGVEDMLDALFSRFCVGK